MFENHRKSLIQHCEQSDKSSLKMSKMVQFGEFLETSNLRSNSVTRQVSFNRTKIGGKCQNAKNSNATYSTNYTDETNTQINTQPITRRNQFVKAKWPEVVGVMFATIYQCSITIFFFFVT